MKNNIAYYLSKGFDEKTARYFASGRKKVVSAVPQEDYTLLLTFDNGETRLYDMRPLLKPNTVFSVLAEKGRFASVYIDDAACVAWDIDPNVDSKEVWNNKLDLSSDSCYLDSTPVSGGAANA